MKGLTVSVGEKGSTADSLASAFLKKHPGYFKVVRYSNTTDTAVALQQGRVDVVVGDHVAYAYALRNRSDFGVGATIEGSVVPVGLPFRPGDKRIAQFNKAINQLKRNGTIAKIYKKWVGTAPAANNAAAKVVPPVTAKTCFKI
jgi:polar amino acid transport system substrate-binding protein